MKKMILIAILMVFICENFYGQRYPRVVLSKRFKYDDMFYASSYKGLKTFMSDIQSESPALYDKLLPEYKEIKYKRNAAIVSIVTGGVIGTAMMIPAFTGNTDPGSPTFTKDAQHNVGLSIAGGAVFAAGLLIGYILSPKEDDIYRFLNLHNKYSPDKKLEWEYGLKLDPNSAGLRLALRF